MEKYITLTQDKQNVTRSFGANGPYIKFIQYMKLIKQLTEDVRGEVNVNKLKELMKLRLVIKV